MRALRSHSENQRKLKGRLKNNIFLKGEKETQKGFINVYDLLLDCKHSR